MKIRDSKFLASILLVASAVFLIVGAIAAGAVPITGPSAEQAPPINDSESVTEATNPNLDQSLSPQQYAVTVMNTTATNHTALTRYGTVGTQADRRLELSMSPSNVSAVQQLSWVTDVQPALRPAPADVPGASDGESLGVERLHQRGVTGGEIKIGIIDSGFDERVIKENVEASVSFRGVSDSPAHGTAVAEVVTRTAPDSELYLVSTETSVDNERAIEYLVNRDVDIIVYSLGWPAVEDDGDHFLTDDIVSARQQGTLFVVSAGNGAELHWEEGFRDTDRDQFLEWGTSGDEQNALLDRDGTPFSGGKVSVYVRWEDQGVPSAYRVALYNPDTEQYVTTSSGVSRVETNRYAVLDTTLRAQPLRLVVQNTVGAADDEIEVIVNGPKKLERTVPGSSLSAPADVPAAVSVGAYERGKYVPESRIAPYSSRGPTDDGRIGIDVTGYTNFKTSNGFYTVFAGTSAAAPYVGGVAALIEDQYGGDASPKKVETALESTSDDIRRSGSDTISGAGVVNAVDGVDSVNISTTTSTLTPIADAGSNQTVKTGTVVRLNATGSSDPDSDTLSYAWTKISGAPVTLSGASTVTSEFTPTVAGTYTFELTVSDGTASDTDSVTITVGSPLEDAPGKFDSDGDGTISQTELSEAAFAFATGQVSQAELSEVAFAFATG